MARNNHGPLYFVVAKLWSGVFGDSSLALRSLSVVMGELTILGMYLLTREGYRLEWNPRSTGNRQDGRPERVALLAAVLVALGTF